MSKLRFILKLKYGISNLRITGVGRHSCSIGQLSHTEKNVESLFLDRRVQELLTKITGFCVDKVSRPFQENISAPKYQFLTNAQLEEVIKKANKKARAKLQMPPVMKARKLIDTVIANDPELQGLGYPNVIFIDLTRGISHRERQVVVREASGILREALWEERDRMLQIYFPVENRNFHMPTLFQDHNLQHVLDQNKYEYVLDRACQQFEPDDPEYIRVTTTTYEHVDKNRKHHLLHSTRHFGPMTFYLVVHRNIDNLLAETIQKEMLEDAVDLVGLYHLVHPECASAQSRERDVLHSFVDKDARNADGLRLVLDTYREIQKQRALLQEGICKAHSQS